ncbi:MAG TPA: hypothetical protein VHR45_09490 [Thermoanaerobaculia bacterium]|nr:hypothetical protein [Thermoanaerobaculia bacterium]
MIQEVLTRHQRRLMGIPGVVGVGVGERAGLPTLKVMLNRPLADLPTTLPTVLEGIPLEVEVVGEISAL